MSLYIKTVQAHNNNYVTLILFVYYIRTLLKMSSSWSGLRSSSTISLSCPKTRRNLGDIIIINYYYLLLLNIYALCIYVIMFVSMQKNEEIHCSICTFKSSQDEIEVNKE